MLDDHGLLLLSDAQRVVTLNPTATFLRLCAEQGMTANEAVLALVRTGGIDRATAADYLRALLARWDSMLAGQPRPSWGPYWPPHPDGNDTAAEDSEAPHAGPHVVEIVETRCYWLYGEIVRIRFGTGDAVSQVGSLLESCALPSQISPDRSITIRPDPDEAILESRPVTRYLVTGRQREQRCPRPDRLASVVKSLVLQEVFFDDPDHLWLHAAAVEHKGRSLLFPGASDSGKTTLAAALLRWDCRYIADDVVRLDRRSQTVEGCALGFSIKEGALAPLARYYPALAALPPRQRSDGKTVRYLPVAHAATDQGEPRQPAMFIFPRYRPDQPATLTSLSPVECLNQLLSQCYHRAPMTGADLQCLIDLARRTPAWSLSYDALPEALQIVEDRLTSIAPAEDRIAL